MFYRLIAKHTRDHLRDHMTEYLGTAEGLQDSDIRLPRPKRFDIGSFVGGVVGITLSDPKSFPALALDALTRQWAGTDENFYAYRYDGHVTGMVVGTNPDLVERTAKGYLTALDLFCSEHAYIPLPDAFDKSTLPFSFLEFAGIRSEHFGAAQVTSEEGATDTWIDGFRLEIAWTVSEPGNGQHGG